MTSPTTGAASAPALPDYAPVPRSALGPALNDQGYCVGRVERNLYAGASSLFDRNVVRIGHEETRRLLLRDNDPARPAPEETFQDRRTLEIGGERIELAWHGSNHTPDHDTLMLVDIVNPGWGAPVYISNLTPPRPRLRLPGSPLSIAAAGGKPSGAPTTTERPNGTGLRHRRGVASFGARIDRGTLFGPTMGLVA